MRSSPRAAFTLVELSIVLAVLGLIAGGVMAGQSMVQSSRVNRVGTELLQYDAAVQNFRARYRAWPGDMMNATNYWGAASGGCPSGTGTGTQTCDGNGNGLIVATEYYRAWQHLANAGLVGGKYTGVAGSGGANHHVLGENCPTGPIKGTGYGIVGTATASFTSFGTINGNLLVFGGQHNTTVPNAGALTGTEALTIDTKIDDSKPGTGIVQQYSATTRPNCVTSDDPVTATYDLRSRASRRCPIVYKMANQKA